jgi:hypothetical protein
VHIGALGKHLISLGDPEHPCTRVPVLYLLGIGTRLFRPFSPMCGIKHGLLPGSQKRPLLPDMNTAGAIIYPRRKASVFG